MFGRPSVGALILAITELLQIGRALALPTTGSQIETTDNFDCVFKVSPDDQTTLTYDLCPLLKLEQYRVSREVETPPSRTKVSLSLEHPTAYNIDSTW